MLGMRRRILAVATIAALAVPALAGPAMANQRDAEHRFSQVRDHPAKLEHFLDSMPKGADLHTHLTGAVRTESLIKWGAADGLCVNLQSLTAVSPPCTDAAPPLTNALASNSLRDRVLDAWSMRGFDTSEQSGHDHFFATFGLFRQVMLNRIADGLTEITDRAATQNILYMEPMTSPSEESVYSAVDHVTFDAKKLKSVRNQLVSAGIFHSMGKAKQDTVSVLKKSRQQQQCGTKKAANGCNVKLRFDIQVARDLPPQDVFGQLVFGFELMKRDPHWAGINLVQAEDGNYSMRDYRLHMRMIRLLRSLYPHAKVSLHAGELVPRVASPADLRFHIRSAVEVARADRIGHGADLRWEARPRQLLREIRERGTCVEINLTSNAQILGLRGKRHPIRDYLKAHVKVALSTDDQGISRTDLTDEYVRAVREQGLSYDQLKQIARTSLECAFLPADQKRTELAKQAMLFRAFESRYSSH